MSLFDAYELRARLTPALIVTSPFLLVAGAVAPPTLSNALASSASGLIFLALLYLFSFLVREAGRRIESSLWRSWGGPPSTIVLTESDETFSAQTKQEIFDALSSVMHIQGAIQPGWARAAGPVQDAFSKVRQFIRQHDPAGLWARHNAEYGFLRNLLGAWWLWLINCSIAALACGAVWYYRGGEVPAALAWGGAALAVVAISARSVILPKAVRSAAFRYAESAWLSFLTQSKAKSTQSWEGLP